MYKVFGLSGHRLTFDRSPYPNEFCVISESCTDLAYDIVHYPQWDPKKLSSPQANLLLFPILLDASIPYNQHQDFVVDILSDDWGCINDFINDEISRVPDINDNCNRAVPTILLAIINDIIWCVVTSFIIKYMSFLKKKRFLLTQNLKNVPFFKKVWRALFCN